MDSNWLKSRRRRTRNQSVTAPATDAPRLEESGDRPAPHVALPAPSLADTSKKTAAPRDPTPTPTLALRVATTNLPRTCCKPCLEPATSASRREDDGTKSVDAAAALAPTRAPPSSKLVRSNQKALKKNKTNRNQTENQRLALSSEAPSLCNKNQLRAFPLNASSLAARARKSFSTLPFMRAYRFNSDTLLGARQQASSSNSSASSVSP